MVQWPIQCFSPVSGCQGVVLRHSGEGFAEERRTLDNAFSRNSSHLLFEDTSAMEEIGIKVAKNRGSIVEVNITTPCFS